LEEFGSSNDDLWDPSDSYKTNEFYRRLLYAKISPQGKNLRWSVKRLVLAARVFLKKPELLLLDDDLTIIDYFRRKNIRRKLWAMDCTIISIVNDFQNILNYDRVLFLEDGKVVENGNPKDLIKNKKSRLFSRLLLEDLARFRSIMKNHSRFSISTRLIDGRGSVRLSVIQKPILLKSKVEEVKESEGEEHESSDEEIQSPRSLPNPATSKF
jgi:ABC-type sulfate/molybdate transport systems ATPase subunit